jgi:TolB-like protein
MSFWGELKRRNVVKVAIAYAIVSWLLIQVAGLVLPTLLVPDWILRAFVVLLVLVFPVALLLAWAYEVTPEGIKRTADVPPTESITRVTGHRLNYVVTALLAIAVIFLIVDRFVLAPEGRAPGSATAGAREGEGARLGGAPIGDAISVAVLPFRNLSADPEQQYFTDGFSEELLNSLAQIKDLRVPARTSSFSLADSTLGVREIAAALDVDYVLEGNVRIAEGTVRITAQLVSAEDGTQLWSQPYDRDFEQVLAIQEEIAMAVAERLSATFGIGEFDVLAGGTRNVEAYDHYLQAQALSRDVINLQRVADEYRRALELDPEFGLAEIGLGRTINFMAGLGLGNSSELREEARAAYARAAERVPDHPAVSLFALSQHVVARDWSAAESALEAQLRRSALSDYQTNMQAGSFLREVGYTQSALTYLERARRLDPLAAAPVVQLAMVHDALRNHERALELDAEARTLLGYDLLGMIQQFWRVLAAGDPVAAKQEFSNPAAEYLLTIPTFAFVDDPERGLAELRVMYDQATQQANATVVFANVALLAGYYGDRQLAIDAWAKTLPAAPGYLSYLWHPIMRDVRAEPRFKDLIRSVGLDSYWRESGWPEQCKPLGNDDFECI